MATKPHGADGKSIGEKEIIAHIGYARENSSGWNRRKLAPIGRGKQRGTQLRMSLQQPTYVPELASIQVSACLVRIGGLPRVNVIYAETHGGAFPGRKPVRPRKARVA